MSSRLAEKVLLVGWDAADWSVIQPLSDQGLMPNVKRLMDHGARGKIAALQPMLSPVLWTSIATGKRPHQHGIHGLSELNTEAGGIRRVSSTSRTTKAIWNILTQNGMATHVIGWRGAHPAEPINGVNVTDLHAVAMAEYGKPWPQPEGSFHPPELGPTLASLRVHPYQLDRETLAYFVPDLAAIGLRDMHRLTACSRGLAAAVTNHAAATWAMEHRPWDFMAICYSGIEYFSHSFMNYMPPRQEWISPEEFARYQHVVTACYRFHDLMLGRLLELAGDETTVILVSDHGCKTGTMRPATVGKAPEDVEAWHRRLGVCVMQGRHIKPGATITGASILDVTPTILALFGLPLGMDMDGQPKLELFDVDVEPDQVASWDQVSGASGMHPAGDAEPHRELRSMLQQLQEMGYSDPREDQLEAMENGVAAKNQFNLARSLIDGGHLRQAVEILEKLTAKFPLSHSVAAVLIEVYLMSGRCEDARSAIERFLPEHADTTLVNLTLGRIKLEQGRPEAALAYLHHAEQLGSGNPRIHVFTGQAYLDLRRWQDARLAFQRALELEPDHAEALHGLCIVCLREHNARDAMAYAAAAINSYEPTPAAHYHLGVALATLGRHARAALAFERALALDPCFRAARRRLLYLYKGVLHEPTRARQHQQLDEQLRHECRTSRHADAADAKPA